MGRWSSTLLDRLVQRLDDRGVNRAWLLVAPAFSLACERGELLGSVRGRVGQGGTAGAGGSPEGGGAPDPVSPLSDPIARDTDPTPTADRTLLYFMSTRAGGKDIWQSERADPSEDWGTPTLVEGISTNQQEENPRLSSDGLRLWFFSDRDRAASDLWESTRASRTDPWK